LEQDLGIFDGWAFAITVQCTKYHFACLGLLLGIVYGLENWSRAFDCLYTYHKPLDGQILLNETHCNTSTSPTHSSNFFFLKCELSAASGQDDNCTIVLGGPNYCPSACRTHTTTHDTVLASPTLLRIPVARMQLQSIHRAHRANQSTRTPQTSTHKPHLLLERPHKATSTALFSRAHRENLFSFFT
jgi:hypothetical protein